MKLKEAENIGKKIKSKEWEVIYNNLDAVQEEDSVYWYGFGSDTPILFIRKGKKVISLFADGDIEIYNPKNEDDHFIFHGGKPDMGIKDKLTKNLVKTGTWEANNWFSVTDNFLHYDLEDIYLSISEAVTNVFEKMEEKNNE